MGEFRFVTNNDKKEKEKNEIAHERISLHSVCCSAKYECIAMHILDTPLHSVNPIRSSFVFLPSSSSSSSSGDCKSPWILVEPYFSRFYFHFQSIWEDMMQFQNIMQTM